MDVSAIAEKVRKLLALSARAGTEAEALVAVETARAIVARHNLDAGILTLQEELKAEQAETQTFRRMPPHYVFLASACDVLLDVRWFMTTSLIGDKHIVFIGLPVNVQVAVLTFEYLRASVESLLNGRHEKKLRMWSKPQYRAFRLGVSKRVYGMASDAKNAQCEQSAESAALIHIGGALADKALDNLGIKGKLNANYKTDQRSAELQGFHDGRRIDIHGARSSRMLSAPPGNDPTAPPSKPN